MYASVDYDAKTANCAASCGERKTTSRILDEDAKQALLGKVTSSRRCTSARPTTWRATSRAATSTSTSGNTPETEKSFRLFVGPKGAMKLQKMTNAVADTEGEIFTTKSGSLRYVTDRKNPPIWIQGEEELKLTVVPLEGTDARPASRSTTTSSSTTTSASTWASSWQPLRQSMSGPSP